MFSTLLNNLKWFFLSLGLKFFQVAPGYTISVAILNLLSHFSMLCSFLIPLKVLLLLGAPELPSFFPESWKSENRQELIIISIIVTAAIYSLHLLCEKLIEICTVKGANELLLKSKKIMLFKNQDEIAIKAYGNYTLALANLFFVTIGLIIILYIYPLLAAVLLIYIILSVVLLSIGYQFSKKIRFKLEEELAETIRICTAIGFFIAFGVIVYLFLQNPNADIAIAIAALILMRLMMNKTSQIIKRMMKLFSKRSEIDVLFFHNKPYIPLIEQDERIAWEFTDPDYRHAWLKQALSAVVLIPITRMESKWHQLNDKHILAFDVTAITADSQTHYFFVKLYTRIKYGQATHEVDLLSDPTSHSLPALTLLANNEIDGYPCNVFASDNLEHIDQKSWSSSRLQILDQLFFFRPTEKLIKQYKRSRPLLYDRIVDHMVPRLRQLVHDPVREKEFRQFEEALPSFCAKLARLPLQIINPDIDLNHLVKHQTQVKMTHWGNWELEPLGAAWPVNRPKRLYRMTQQLQALHPEIKICAEDVRLCSLLYALNAYYLDRKYSYALDLIPEILKLR